MTLPNGNGWAPANSAWMPCQLLRQPHRLRCARIACAPLTELAACARVARGRNPRSMAFGSAETSQARTRSRATFLLARYLLNASLRDDAGRPLWRAPESRQTHK